MIGKRRMSRRMWKAAVCGWMLWGAVTSHAAEVSVGVETVRSHLTGVFAKSGAKNRAELVTLAVAAVFGVGPEEVAPG